MSIAYRPCLAFVPYHSRRERFAVGVAHRRCGKTVATINDLVARACRPQGKVDYRAGYIAPFRGQAKDAAWMYLKRATEENAAQVLESDLIVYLKNGARLRIYGADNAEAIRGGYFDDVIIDEYADMAPGVWSKIVRPMLADREGSATFIGTPKGRNAFYKLYERAQGDPRYFTFFLPASETGILPQSELDDAKQDMTPEEYDQEFNCSFDAAIMGAYYGKEIAAAERNNQIREVEIDPRLPHYSAWDLGIGDSMSIWIFQIAGRELRVIDHIENSGYEIAWYAEEMKQRGYAPETDYVPHDAQVREMGTGKTRVEFLVECGRKPVLIPLLKIEDGINYARVIFPRIYFNAGKCADGVEALRQYRVDYDEKTRAFKDKPRHDWTSHTADAFRYMCSAYREIAEPETLVRKPDMRPISQLSMDEIMDFEDSYDEPERRV